MRRIFFYSVLYSPCDADVYSNFYHAHTYIPYVDKPVVEVIMDPETPVNEADRQNVSLTCEVDAGNPAMLTAVRWYLDGDLLKELPDCPTRNSTAMTTTTEESSTGFCDIDPSKLLLESVGRTFHGNYSCEGRNEAGWGPISPSTPVIVYCKSSLSRVNHSCYAMIEEKSARYPLRVPNSVIRYVHYSRFELHICISI